MRNHWGRCRKDYFLRDVQRALLVKTWVIAKAGEIQFQRLAFDDHFVWYVVDDQMREVWLAGDRANGRKFRYSKSNQIGCVGMWVWHAIERRCLGRFRGFAGLA